MSGSPTMFYIQSTKRAIPVSSLCFIQKGEDYHQSIPFSEEKRTIAIEIAGYSGYFYNIYKTTEERDNTMYAYTWTNTDE